MSRTKKDKPISKRNGFALAAKMRSSGGPMKHRLQPKDGAKNEQAEILKELEETYVCGKCGIGQEIFTRECLNCGGLGTIIIDGGDCHPTDDNDNDE